MSPAREQRTATPGLPAAGRVEIVSTPDAMLLRGGDKEYTPPFYENAAQAHWSRPSILLNE